jgi:GntR family transcriptional regulator/MocR family aminotransferase
MWITIDKTSHIALSRQVYSQIKELILSGSLAANEKLPSTRSLSKELSLSRNTILESYDQLIAEGYLESKPGSGTTVANGIIKYKSTPSVNISSLAPTPVIKKDYIDFRSGLPALDLFPQKKWAKLYSDICNTIPASAFDYCSPSGVWELRNSISKYLFRTRGIQCRPEQIMIVSGTTQGLFLISKILYKSDHKVLVEDPIHVGLLNTISSMGYDFVPIKADDKGMNTDLLKPYTNISFIYTTPSHQYPLGGILPIQRRLSLIQYACDNNCYIVEDDYDSEFRYEGAPVSSLYELNPNKVIYIGSFSKLLSPAIRLGFMLLPNELLDTYKPSKMYSDVHTEAISQYVLAEFINNGSLEKHIWKMKKIYAIRRNHLIKELNQYFRNEFQIKGQATGLHIVVAFKNITFTQSLVQQLLEQGIKIYPVEHYCIQNKEEHIHEIILGYAHLSLDQISTGIELLSKILHQ